jgi:hypothetical protein
MLFLIQYEYIYMIMRICFRRHVRSLCREAHNQEIVISNSCVTNPEGSKKLKRFFHLIHYVPHVNRTVCLMYQIDYVVHIENYPADNLFEMLKSFCKLFPRVSLKWSQ